MEPPSSPSTPMVMRVRRSTATRDVCRPWTLHHALAHGDDQRAFLPSGHQISVSPLNHDQPSADWMPQEPAPNYPHARPYTHTSRSPDVYP